MYKRQILDGEKVKKCNYLGGADSGTSMAIFPYIPERAGYKFIGWNSKKDGSGNNYKYIYWRAWSAWNDEESEFERDGLIEDKNMYRNLTSVSYTHLDVYKRQGLKIKETTKSDAFFQSPDIVTIQYSKQDHLLNKDKVFFISAEEVAKYMPEKKQRIAYLHDGKNVGKAESWWLRSPRENSNVCAGRCV